jgi:tetratricopeptide (TPR) repeat protein
MELTITQALQQAIAAHKEGKLQEAEHLYRAILQSQPEHPDANHNLGVLAVSVGKVEGALPYLKAALEANPKIEQFWLSYIEALIKAKQYDKGESILANAQKFGFTREKFDSVRAQLTRLNHDVRIEKAGPTHQELKKLLQHYENGGYGDAEVLAKSIVQQFPTHPFGWKMLGVILKKTDRNLASLNANKKALLVAPHDGENYYNLANGYKELRDHCAAIINYKKAITLQAHITEAYYNLGIIFNTASKYDSAIVSYKKSAASTPNFFNAYNNLGGILKNLNYHDSALSVLSKALIIEENPHIQHTINGLKGVTTAKAPPQYVKGLFDQYAENFDNHLQFQLGYRAPELVR